MNKDKFLIKGLGGKKSLEGEISVGGAKNAALKLFAASILFKDKIELNNVPEIEDIKRMSELLVDMGMSVERKDTHSFTIIPSSNCSTLLSPEISKNIRASVVLTGPVLSRFGKVSFPHPGGCVIGKRPIDLYMDGFKKMGAKVNMKDDCYVVETIGGKLIGATIFLKNQSVTATETFMMAGVLAEGETIIKNSAIEPEIEHLANFLISGGANIKGIGTTTLTITGGGLLSIKNDSSFSVMPDRIEAGSFLILGALASKQLEIKKCNPQHLESLIESLRVCGVKIETNENTIKVFGVPGSEIKPMDIKTHEYPGFPTDLQAPMTVFLTQSNGESLMFETIFEGRLNYFESLIGMGADIKMMDPHRIIIKGPSVLHGKTLESPDLRAGLAFVIAAIIAKGDSVVHSVYNIDRGYENIEKRFKKIGIDITRVSE